MASESANNHRPVGYIVVGDMNRWPPATVLEVLKQVGAESVDWGIPHFDPLDQDPGDLVALVELSQAHGLGVGQLSVPQDFVVTDPEQWEVAVRRSERAIDACARAGIASFDFVTGPLLWSKTALRVGTHIDEATAWERVFTALARILARAESEGVIVSVEPVWGTLARSAYRMDYLLTQLDHPSLGVTVDPSHFVMTGDDTPAFIRRWGHIIAHVHIKDAFGSDGMHFEDFLFTLPGEGSVDWQGFFDALNETGYRGPMNVEFEADRLLAQAMSGDAAEAARLSLSLSRALIAKFDRTATADRPIADTTS